MSGRKGPYDPAKAHAEYLRRREWYREWGKARHARRTEEELAERMANQRDYRKRPEVKARNQEWRAAWDAQHPEVKRAHLAIYRAVRDGQIVRPSACEECATACVPTAAHYNYEQPLVVRWMCRRCHGAWDQAIPKTRMPQEAS